MSSNHKASVAVSLSSRTAARYTTEWEMFDVTL